MPRSRTAIRSICGVMCRLACRMRAPTSWPPCRGSSIGCATVGCSARRSIGRRWNSASHCGRCCGLPRRSGRQTAMRLSCCMPGPPAFPWSYRCQTGQARVAALARLQNRRARRRPDRASMRGCDRRLDRLKMCASEECRWVFYDRSKPGTGRRCASALCATGRRRGRTSCGGRMRWKNADRRRNCRLRNDIARASGGVDAPAGRQ
jgi:hypothetical protein